MLPPMNATRINSFMTLTNSTGTMDLSRLTSQIKQSEGLRLKAYKDSLGFWTIGYGHLLNQSQDWSAFAITEDQAGCYLAADIAVAQQNAICLLEWPALDRDARQNAVVELVFNLGCAKWKLFAHCRLAITQKDWQTAHDQLLDSVWAKQVGQERSTRLANQLLTGEFA